MKELQDEFEKMMITYIGTSIENKPAWMKQGEKLHKNLHQKITGNYVPTIEETIIYINCWLDFYNSKPCPNDRTKTIKQCLESVQKQDIDINKLDYLMMKSEVRTITRSGITFLGLLFRNEMLMDYRERVFIRYSLFDLTKIFVYSLKGEFLCTAYQVEKVHPMAEHLGTVTDMELLGFSFLSALSWLYFVVATTGIHFIVLGSLCSHGALRKIRNSVSRLKSRKRNTTK